MRFERESIMTTLCLLSAVFSGTALYGQQSPPSAPMTVVNTNANPIPVRAPSPLPVSAPSPLPVSGTISISGTPTVTVANTPLPVAGSVVVSNAVLPVNGTVAATQSGPWLVGLAGTPTVNLNAGASNPVATRDVDNAAKSRFAFRLPASGGSFTVPAGKIAVIETVTGKATGSSPGFYVPSLDATTGGNFVSYPISQAIQDANATSRVYVATHAVRIYADPGTTVTCSPELLSSTGLVGTLTVSGHYVDLP